MANIENTRRFTAVGILQCEFEPEILLLISTIEGLTVEVWQKSPLEVFFLGRGTTDSAGNFSIPFEVLGSPSYVVDGEISNVFLKVYFRGKLLTGANPYIPDGNPLTTRPLRNLTLREGLTDLGTLQFSVTEFEFSEDAVFVDDNPNIPEQAWDFTFGSKFTSGELVPAGYRYEFKVKLQGLTDPIYETSSVSVKDEYIRLDIPPLPVVPEPTSGDFLIQISVDGEVESASRNCYLSLPAGRSSNYTLLSDLYVNNQKLSVKVGTTFYDLADNITITASHTAIYIDASGNVYGRLNQGNFESLGQLTFYQIEFPDQMTTLVEGIYSPNVDTGRITAGFLGTQGTTFDNFSLSVKNPTPVKAKVRVKVYTPTGVDPIYNALIAAYPGSKDVVPVTIEGSLPTTSDPGPSLADIEQVSGTTFSPAFTTFLQAQNLDGLNLIKNAGPIEYLKGLPAQGITSQEKALLQGHVDLYTVNEDITENQHIYTTGYTNLFDIANTPKDQFIGDIAGTAVPYYKTAEIQEVIIQNQKLVTNMLAARLSDYELADPVFPSLPTSDFADTEFAAFINKCECDDCKSSVSPFAYFVDLIKYGARHIRKTGANAYSPVNYSAFLSLLQNYFVQPFGSLNVDCNTLFDQYCRVRLVTEVLETYVDQQTLPQPVLDKLADDRNKYLLLTYRTLLDYAGTSYEELRDIVKTQPLADKVEKAESWSSRIGIPRDVPGTSDLTADRIWLTFDNTNPDNVLNGVNLETIFGFRDTERDVLTTPPASLMSTWQQVHLKNLWRIQDFPFSSYSRENVDPTAVSTIKENWLPIVEPDIIGRSDLTYLSLDFAKELLKHRKAETDAFLKYYITDSSLVQRTSVDMDKRILRVAGRDITSHEIENNEIQIEDSGSVFQTFNLLNRSLINLDTDVILKKSTLTDPQPPIFQPNGIAPVMRYNRVLNLTSGDISIDNSGPIVVTIDFVDEPLFQDVLSGGLLKLTSDSSTEVYTNVSPATGYGITAISYTLPFQVSFQISQEDAAFFAGNLKVVYGVEVPLYTNVIPNPEAICDELFDIDQSYNFLSPTPSGETSPFNYRVWVEPTSWPPGINLALSDYGKLKEIYQLLTSGNATDAQQAVITDNLFLNTASFISMMEFLIACENYLESMYTFTVPTETEQYNLTSIFRISAKHQLRQTWIVEEIKHDPMGGTNYIELMLDGQYFWKALNEPQIGVWDPMLQTIPELATQITDNDIPIIDPELLKVQDLLTSPDAEPYRVVYNDRRDELVALRDEHLSWLVPFNVDGFEEILNHVNTDNEATPYTLPDYANLDELIADFESTDPFRINKAETNLWEAFRISGADFSVILPIKRAYEAADPLNVPSTNGLKTSVDLLTTGYKRRQLYGTTTAGWVYDEVFGLIGTPIQYYDVMKMRLPSFRGSFSNRSEWQRTLENWNRTPAIQPDIVPPENINNFTTGATVHDIWVVRKGNIDTLRAGFETDFNDTIIPATLLTNYQLLLAMAIARTDDNTITVADYLNYFLNLEEMENAGEDIRPYLELYGISITAYRVLRSVYTIIDTAVANAQPVDLLESEYTDVLDILVAIHSGNIMPFEAVQEEYTQDVILSGEDFQNYKPSPVELGVTLIDEPNKWRAPLSLRREWKDTLQTRIDRSENVKEQWADVLLDVEEITMPMMRDALIQALRGTCESFEEACERLAKRLFIETKDNCCVKHSRVSFAIETIQGFIFSLESGVFDDELTGFSISAPNFKKEWEWLGSYATWRSAVFTYIFPENLLYPTLKRLQSPPFRELSQTIRNANRFSPDDACRAAQRFEDEFEDLQHLKMICTTNTQAYFFNEDPFDCCVDTNSTLRRYTTFYFAQSETSGRSYWSEKPYYYTDESQHSFWEELPLADNVEILGSFALARDYDDNHQPTDLALWLFYTYRSEGEMKMAYIQKDLMTAGSDWGEENEIELPDLTDLVVDDPVGVNPFTGAQITIKTQLIDSNERIVKVTACQHSVEWQWPSFIFTYKSSNGTFKHIHVRYFFSEDTFDDGNNTTIIVFEKDDKLPITGVLHDLNAAPSTTKPAITVMFDDEIQTGYFGSFLTVPIPPTTTSFDALIGCYLKPSTQNELIVFERDNFGSVNVNELVLTLSGTTIGVASTTLTKDGFIRNVKRVAPIFKQSRFPGGFAVEAYSDRLAVGTRFDVSGSNITSDHRFGLTIEKVSLVSIHSGDCIENFDARIQDIRNHLRANLNPPQGNPIGDFIRTNTVKAYLYEAYYFVPMLLALDQQQRGQFESALSWYQSVYDYTNNIVTKRKIFYGLVLEQSIANVYQRPADWLLDPLNPHLIAETRANSYTKYTLMNIIQCMIAYADREFTMDTIETVPRARKLYTEALALMEVRELNLKPSECIEIAYACLEQNVALPADGYWNNSFSQLQEGLASFNDVTAIQAGSDAITNIFNDTTLSFEEKFADAFEYLDNNAPAPGTPETTTVFMDGIGQRMNDSYRFLIAGIDLQSYNEAVAEKVGVTVGDISKIAPSELGSTESEAKIGWLSQPEKSNAEPFTFEFTDVDGAQLLEGEFQYDPMVPYRPSYQANLAYANALEMYDLQLYPEPFTPLIDYRFCLPENPVYDALELKANLELYKIHNCRNIAGMVRELDIFAAPTDSTTGVPVIGASGNLVLPGVGAFTPSQYRFQVLIERAKSLVSQAQQLESQFLSTLEKEDSERYNLLKARQDLQSAKATVKLQDLRVRRANNERGLAELQLDKVEFSFNHFDNLIETGLIGFEIASFSLLQTASVLQFISSISKLAAAGVFSGTGQFGKSVLAIADSSNELAQALTTQANVFSQLASYQRRAQEWQFQRELAGFDIQISRQQIRIAEDNIRIASQELKISELNNEHAEDTLEFLKNKFTNAELYRWMGNVLERSYSYMLSLATAVARTAERQYYFEQQEQAGPFILDDYWEVQEIGAPTQGGSIDRRGLTGSARLLQDITRLDQFAFENTKRKLQITKTVSLAQFFPEEFQIFRETGVLDFELTNQMFDYDFPGQYIRLIKGINVAVLGLTPVNDGIKAMLTAGSTSYTVIEANNTFQRIPIRRLENEEIALSSPFSNNGLFELQPVQQEFLNPFEGMGVESRWEFKMPKYSNRMDYGQVADILVEIEYTALDNFQYRYQVLQENDNRYNFSRGFSFKNDFPDQWYELAEAQEGNALFGVEFEIERDSFPQGLDNIQLDGSDLLLYFVREDGFTDEIAIADFNLSSAAPETELEGETLDGLFRAVELTNVLNGDGTPFVSLRLYFDNTVINRELFSEENVEDILLLMSCKAELPNYPL